MSPQKNSSDPELQRWFVRTRGKMHNPVTGSGGMLIGTVDEVIGGANRILVVFDDDHGHTIASFKRGGRTCVLSGHVEHRPTLVNLASWKGDGEVRF